MDEPRGGQHAILRQAKLRDTHGYRWVRRFPYDSHLLHTGRASKKGGERERKLFSSIVCNVRNMVFVRRFNSNSQQNVRKGIKVSDASLCYLGMYEYTLAALVSQFVGNPYKADLTLTERHAFTNLREQGAPAGREGGRDVCWVMMMMA